MNAKQVASRLYPNCAIGKNAILYNNWRSGELSYPVEYITIGVYYQDNLVETQSNVVGNLFLIPASVYVKKFKSNDPGREVKFMTTMLRTKQAALSSTHAGLSAMVKGLYGDEYEVDLTPANRHVMGFGNSLPLVMSAFGGVGLLIVVIGSIGILSTMMVNVLERTKEIGTKKALGAVNTHLFLSLQLKPSF